MAKATLPSVSSGCITRVAEYTSLPRSFTPSAGFPSIVTVGRPISVSLAVKLTVTVSPAFARLVSTLLDVILTGARVGTAASLSTVSAASAPMFPAGSVSDTVNVSVSSSRPLKPIPVICWPAAPMIPPPVTATVTPFVSSIE